MRRFVFRDEGWLVVLVDLKKYWRRIESEEPKCRKIGNPTADDFLRALSVPPVNS